MGMTILLCFTTDDAATAFSGGASNQDARSVKSRITVATTGTTSKAKRKLRASPKKAASPQKATTRSTAFNNAIQKAGDSKSSRAAADPVGDNV